MSESNEKYEFNWQFENALNISNSSIFAIPDCFELRISADLKKRKALLVIQFVMPVNQPNPYTKVKIEAALCNYKGKDYSRVSTDDYPWNLTFELPQLERIDNVSRFNVDWNLKGTVSLWKDSPPTPSYCETCRDLSKSMRDMYRNRHGTDVTFDFGGKELYAHKLFLKFYSPVFETMLNHDLLEGTSNRIVITDIDYHVFDCFLIYAYTNEIVAEDLDTVLALYYTADKYQVKCLQKECSKILVENLTVDVACKILRLSYLHADKELQNDTMMFLSRHFQDIAVTTEWGEIVSKYPELASETMKVISTEVANLLPHYLRL